MTHGQLVERAVRWLSGTKRCPLVLSGVASTSEIPDAIGWSTAWKQRGSMLVECKTSISDLLADKRKHHCLKELCSHRLGKFRYFFVDDDLVDATYIEKHFPDHGLAIVRKDRVYEVRLAPPRMSQNYEAEIRLLVFAHVNGKKNLSEQWSDLFNEPAPEPQQGAMNYVSVEEPDVS